MTYVPQPGDIGLTQISGLGGRAIRLAQWLNGDGYKHNVQHAFVVVGVFGGVPEIVEAMPGGAQLVRNWHPASSTVYLRCPAEHREAVAEAARALKGVPYSAADYLSLTARRFHLPVPHLRRYIKASGHMICSQLADHAALKGGWHLFKDNRWEGDVTPGDLVDLYQVQRTARAATGDTER